MTLFREDFKRNRGNPALGSVSISTGIAPKAILITILIIFLAAIALAIKLEYRRHITVSGVVAPDKGISQVVSPVNGVLTEISVQEGKRVSEKESVAVVDNRRVSSDGAIVDEKGRLISETISSLQREILLEERNYIGTINQLNLKRLTAKALVEDSFGTVNTETKQLAVHNAILARQESLIKQGFISANQLDDRKLSILTQETGLRRAVIDHRNALLQVQEIEATISSIRRETDQRISALRRQIVSAKSSAAELKEAGPLVIGAPIEGIASGIVARTGQYVREGQTLLSIVPIEQNQKIYLFVPVDRIARIDVKGDVIIRTIANDYRQYGLISARIVDITNVPLGSGEAAIDISRSASPGQGAVYRLTVSVTATSKIMPALKNGMTVEADIPTESRKLASWATAPIERISSSFR